MVARPLRKKPLATRMGYEALFELNGRRPQASRRWSYTRTPCGRSVDMTTNTTDISLQLAQTVVDACMRRAEELDLKMNAAVVDVGANLKAFNRMDGARSEEHKSELQSRGHIVC